MAEATRNEVKQLVYGLTYGMGPSTLAKKMGCSLEKSRGYLEGLKSRFPGLVSFLETYMVHALLKGIRCHAGIPVLESSNKKTASVLL